VHLFLEGLYSGSRRALDGSPRERSIVLQRVVDDTMDGFRSLARSEDEDGLDRLFSSADVDRVHPEVLDVLLALTEEMVLPSLPGFRDRVLGRIVQVDEAIRPMVLRRAYGESPSGRGYLHSGPVVSHDVRKDARAIYRERAKRFGEALRRDGNLDRFYATKSGGKRDRS